MNDSAHDDNGFSLGIPAILVGLVLCFVAACFLFFLPVRMERATYGPNSGFGTTKSEYANGHPKRIAANFTGQRGEIEWRAAWDETGALVVGESGLFVDGVRERELRGGEEADLREVWGAPPGTPFPESLYAEE